MEQAEVLFLTLLCHSLVPLVFYAAFLKIDFCNVVIPSEICGDIYLLLVLS